jgi:RNA polymerase sigma-70 factor (ECF subfamily)
MAPGPGTEHTHAGHSKEEQLSSLFDSCYPRLARYACARLGNPTEAEDVAADVFVRAFESLDSYRERGLPMEAWLFRIARNLVVDRYRRSGRFERSTEDEADLPDSPDPAQVAEKSMLLKDVKEAMQHLTQDQSDVITLRFFGGLSSRETAAALGKSDGSVREMQRAALEKLRRLHK